MKLFFYGRLGDTVGRELDVAAPDGGCTIAELRAILARTHPHAAADLSRTTLRACVDDGVVAESFRVNDDARVEFFPPVSGG